MAAAQAAQRALGAPDVVARKGSGTPLVMVTAYDAPSARAVDTAGVDMILVGDSVAMVVLGYDDTLHVTIDDMVHHTGAVARTKPHALVVADMPWMSYHLGRDDTVANAARLVRAGATAVKLECVPDAVARMVTDSVAVPTIGIGAGRHCDGQVLVYHDILGFEDRVRPKFVRRYADLGGDAARAI